MATPTKVYKAKVHIGVDTECLALEDRRAAVVDIGAIMMMGKFEPCQFQRYIKPSSYADTNFAIDPVTTAWHMDNKPGYLELCESEGIHWQQAAAEFNEWLGGFAANAELHMWSQGKDYDQPILGWLLKQADLKPAFSYRNYHCTRDLLFLNPGARIQGGADKAAHTALADAEWMTAQFKAIVAKSDWYRRLFT